MLKVELDASDGVIAVEPTGTLAAEDFSQISELADPYIEEHGALAGLVIHTQEFPGWDSFGALIQHVRFVREHHEQLAKVALVTDSMLGDSDCTGARQGRPSRTCRHYKQPAGPSSLASSATGQQC